MEKYFYRIEKYINKYKTKKLIFEHGCYNMDVVKVELTDMYKMIIYLGDGKKVNLDLEGLIEDNIQLRYDSKYHAVKFINTF